jgi:Ca2+/Na+ antiporter
MLQYLGTAPFVLHRMFIRFSQPFAFSALVLFWQVVVSNKLYVIIGVSVLVAFGLYCTYMYYVDKNVNSSIRRVARVNVAYEDQAPLSSTGGASAVSAMPGVSRGAPAATAARDRTVSYDLALPLNIPVLDQNFEVLPNRRPFGSSKGSDSESVGNKGAMTPTHSSPLHLARKMLSSNLLGGSAAKTAAPSKAEKASVKAARDSESALSSEDLQSDLDKPGKRSKTAGRDKERRDKSSSKKTRSSSHTARSGKAKAKSHGRRRAYSDVSVDSIAEGEDESDYSESSEEERPRRRKAASKRKSKSRKEAGKKSRKDARRSASKKSGKRRRAVSSSDSSEAEASDSSDARFSHSDSSDDSSQSD